MKLTKSEKIILVGFLFTLLLDGFTTLLFVLKGKGIAETNKLIWKYGWSALPLSIIFSLLFIFLMMAVLIFLRKIYNHYGLRFVIISGCTSMIITRFLISIYNVYFTLSDKIVTVKPTLEEVNQTRFIIFIVGTTIFLSMLLAFYIFQKEFNIIKKEPLKN